MKHSDAFVFFGATGDLGYKKIFPALYRLVKTDRLKVPVIGVAKSGWSERQLVERAQQSVKESQRKVDHGVLERLVALLTYIDGDYMDRTTFESLREKLGSAQHPLYYMAIPPTLFTVVVQALRATGCAEGGRLVVEKPFARSLESARKLGRTILDVFPEESVYRIDHFLGKEPVENLSYFRFANVPFEPIWHRHFVHSVQITLAESFGLGGRGAFYEQVGAIRDVLQNHLLQIVAMLAMEPPARGDSLREQRLRVIRAIQPLRPKDVVRGQFRGYRDEPGVDPNSQVETFCAVKLFIDNSRWANVPFFLRAGKRLPVTTTEARVVFRQPPRPALGDTVPFGATYLRCRLGPDVGIALGLRTKRPGTKMIGHPVELVAHSDPAGAMLPYERLLGDALEGNDQLFTNQEGVENEWRVVDEIVAEPPPLHSYEPGTWGPRQADDLIAGAGPWHAPHTERDEESQ